MWFHEWISSVRKNYNIKGIMIYMSHTILIAGWPIGRDAAINDNEAKS